MVNNFGHLKNDVIYLEPRSKLDDCIIDVDHENNQLIYSYSLLIGVFMEQGMTCVGAIEWIEYNILNCNMKPWPLIIDDWNHGESAHDNFMKLELEQQIEDLFT